jgi:hypothetical protein
MSCGYEMRWGEWGGEDEPSAMRSLSGVDVPCGGGRAREHRPLGDTALNITHAHPFTCDITRGGESEDYTYFLPYLTGYVQVRTALDVRRRLCEHTRAASRVYNQAVRFNYAYTAADITPTPTVGNSGRRSGASASLHSGREKA